MESTLLIYIIFLALGIASTAIYIVYIKKHNKETVPQTAKTEKAEENKQIKELTQNYKNLEAQFHDFMIATKLNPETKTIKIKEETTK